MSQRFNPDFDALLSTTVVALEQLERFTRDYEGSAQTSELTRLYYQFEPEISGRMKKFFEENVIDHERLIMSKIVTWGQEFRVSLNRVRVTVDELLDLQQSIHALTDINLLNIHGNVARAINDIHVPTELVNYQPPVMEHIALFEECAKKTEQIAKKTHNDADQGIAQRVPLIQIPQEHHVRDLNANVESVITALNHLYKYD